MGRASNGLCTSLLSAAIACSSGPATPEEQILSVAETERWRLTGLGDPAYVVRTEANVPHVYAESRNDLARVEGFVLARDRFFMMDLTRRVGLGKLSGLFGDLALETDLESRGVGITFVAEQMLRALPPELAAYFDSFAEGVNAYISAVASDTLPAPSELEIAKGILGTAQSAELMEPFDRRSIAAIYAVVLYQSSYESGDVGNAAVAEELDDLFQGAPFETLRRQGAIVDLWSRIEPLFPVSSAAGFGLEQGTTGGVAPTAVSPSQQSAHAPHALLERLATRLARMERRLLKDKDAGFGSNAWAVAGFATTDGSALIAGDGHLSLAVPSLLYQLGLDTTVFGGGDVHQLGMVIPGLALMPIGTNGRVGWSQTQLMGDVTDWYAEAITLNAVGAPAASRFGGELRPLVRVDERYEIGDRPALGSVGRIETWPRWVTFDGRFIADIEGRSAEPGEAVLAGETLVNMQGAWIVPGDEDGDGVVSGVSFDYTGFDAGSVIATVDALGHANDVRDFVEATRGLVAYSQNFAVADSGGSILYTSFQAVPCRAHLDRNADGTWAPGSDPTLLIDGSRYGGFFIPIVNGVVDPQAGAVSPASCVVPHDQMPHAIDPDRGYVLTANNDPGNIGTDGSLTNDEWYIGGPWDVGFRADTINRELARAVAAGEADVHRMAAIQGNVGSRLGELFTDRMLAGIDRARTLAGSSSPTPDEQRIVTLYTADKDAIDEASARLAAWRDAGFAARSGVKTFYAAPDEQAKSDAVATTVFNAWVARLVEAIFGDESLPDVWKPGGTDGRLRALHRLLDGRGTDNPLGLASFNPATGESVFFDVLATPEVETSTELIVLSLAQALAFLRSEPTAPDEGGFGTTDMSQWLWGMRHYVRFESLVADFVGNDSAYAAITNRFAISTGILPLDAGVGFGDPRRDLEWFPRDGDQDSVDAANPGLSGTSFSYGSGPVMRMVISLNGDVLAGQNIIPGGQSGLVDSPFFADQARLWLANEALPLRFAPADVAAGALGRETYLP